MCPPRLMDSVQPLQKQLSKRLQTRVGPSSENYTGDAKQKHSTCTALLTAHQTPTDQNHELGQTLRVVNIYSLPEGVPDRKMA